MVTWGLPMLERSPTPPHNATCRVRCPPCLLEGTTPKTPPRWPSWVRLRCLLSHHHPYNTGERHLMLGTVVHILHTGVAKIKALPSVVPGCSNRDQAIFKYTWISHHVGRQNQGQNPGEDAQETGMSGKSCLERGNHKPILGTNSQCTRRLTQKLQGCELGGPSGCLHALLLRGLIEVFLVPSLLSLAVPHLYDTLES